jgi:hypothetical protein
MEMIDSNWNRNEPTPEIKGKVGRLTKGKIRERPIGKDIQAYLLNRLVVLVLREPVLSDKVNGCTHTCK